MPSKLTRSTVRIYGALIALGDGSADLLERLLPFFEPILRPLQGNRLDLDSFAKEVRDTYNWNFNTDVVEVFVPRLRDARWITAITPNLPQTNYTITLPDQILNVEIEDTAERKLRAIAENFHAFAQELSPLVEIPSNVEDYEEILIEWLLYVEAFSEKNLDFTRRTVIEPSGALRRVVDVPRTKKLSEEESILCARFVEHAIINDPEASETLARIASIGLLTEVVQDFVKPNTRVESSDLVVYLDAPVAMELLDVSGKAARENTFPIIAELKRIGAKIWIFNQSVEEIKHNLNAVLGNPHPTGPTAQALVRSEVLRDYVSEVAANPGNFLDKLGVKISPRTLEHHKFEFKYFTEEQRDETRNALTFHQENPNARDHDADVTTLIMRQRRGHEDPDIFKARFLLMTRNGLLAQLVRKKCVKLGVLSPNSIPPVVHRKVITASMWLRTGLGADDYELPKRLLLANCERVLAIRPSVVDKVKQLTEALGNEVKTRQLDALINQPRSLQMLMDKTLGAPSVVNPENFEELFDQMIHPHLEKERIRSNEAIDKEKAESRKRVEEVTSKLEQAQTVGSAMAEQLKEKLNEDMAAVKALCKDAACILAAQRRNRRLIGCALALVLCTPPLFEPSGLQSYLSIPPAILLVYLTITGNKLIGTLTSEEHAKETLLRIAEERSLTGKVSHFVIDWRGSNFHISEKTDPVNNSV